MYIERNYGESVYFMEVLSKKLVVYWLSVWPFFQENDNS